MKNEYGEEDTLISRNVSKAIQKWDFNETTEEVDETLDTYNKYIFKKFIFIFACIAITIIVAGVAVTVGSYEIGFIEAYQTIWNHITGNVVDSTKDYIVVTLRLPRVIVGIIAGMGLAVAGTVMQSTLLNPLADPYTTGISSGASFGAVLAITMGATVATGQFAIVLNAFIFSLIPMCVIIFVSKVKQSSPTTMIMAGIAIMFIFNAVTTVLMLRADPNDLQSVYEWQVGSVSRTGWEEIPIMLVVTAIGVIITQFMSRKLNILATGDDSANSLGVNVEKMRILNLCIVSFISAVIVSFTGLLGFIGLVAPHISRIFVGADNRYLIPASAVLGATLLICADLIGRVVFAPAILQAGVVMAFIGGPMFLWLLMKKNSNVWG